MNFRMTTLTGLALVLSACTSVGPVATDPVSARWVGKSAGEFFAAYGPPLTDIETGGTTLYTWRGGFRGPRVCAVELTVSADYRIRKIRATRDHPGKNGPSHCAEVLDAAKA